MPNEYLAPPERSKSTAMVILIKRFLCSIGNKGQVLSPLAWLTDLPATRLSIFGLIFN